MVLAVANSATDLKVDWEEPANAGPPITDYDVRYRAGNQGGYTDVDVQGATATLVTVSGLMPNTAYQVQVRATNDEGSSNWSPRGQGRTARELNVMNAQPEFRYSRELRRIRENTAAGENVGAPVTATDSDGDTLTYTLAGTDAASFDIEPSTGQLLTKATLNYEVQLRYEVTVWATDPQDARDSVDGNDCCEE